LAILKVRQSLVVLLNAAIYLNLVSFLQIGLLKAAFFVHYLQKRHNTPVDAPTRHTFAT